MTDDDPGQGEEEQAGQGPEAKHVSQRCEGQHRAGRDHAERGHQQRDARAAAEKRDPPGADHEDHQGLGGQGFHEPAGAE
jgi:hypothetical protein